MASFALTVPIQPGKTEAVRDYTAQLSGPRFGEERVFHQHAGTRREAAWLQPTPGGYFLVTYWEGEDAERFQRELERFLQNEDGHGAWVRQHFADLFGVDTSGGLPPLPVPLWDYFDPATNGDDR